MTVIMLWMFLEARHFDRVADCNLCPKLLCNRATVGSKLIQNRKKHEIILPAS